MNTHGKLTYEDAEHIRELIEWRRSEIDRINSIASNKALAEKFDVSCRTIENISAYKTHRIRSADISYVQAISDISKKKMSDTKLAKDLSCAGDFTRRTGIPAIDVIREMAPTHTKTQVAKFFGWRDSSLLSSWLLFRGYSVEFKKHIPIPPKRKGWRDITFGSASHV